MENQDDKTKIQLIQKLAELTMLARAHADITQDSQILFISESIQIVIEAGMSLEESILLHRHISRFVNESKAINEKQPVLNYLMVANEISKN